MLRNYFKIAIRTLRKRLGYTAINVVGLAVGLASCILIGLWIQDELSYDRFHANADRTYRVLREFDLPELQGTIHVTPSALAVALEENVPAVERAVRVMGYESPVVKHGRHAFVEPGFRWADAGFFEMFSFPIQRGVAALGRPGTVVLTEPMAAKYFPDQDPIGRTLRVGEREVEVTGIMADVPHNSSFQFDFVGSLETRDPEPIWGLNNFATYILLAERQERREVEAKVREVVRTNFPREAKNAFIPHLQPLTGIHFGQGVSVDIESMPGATRSSILYVYLFGALAMFILLLACINFVNLATARSTERAREVGMRKALGAARRQLAGQFLGESILMSVLAIGLAWGICGAVLPAFNMLAGKEIAFEALTAGPTLAAIGALVVIVGLVAGGYPALVLSGYDPSTVLRGRSRASAGAGLRKGLVVFQFVVAVALIAGTGVIRDQLHFMQSKGLGFDQENVVVIGRAQYLGGQRETFKRVLEQHAGVVEATSGYSLPGTFFLNTMWALDRPEAASHNFNYAFVGYDYVETLGIEMAAGRDFSRAFASDTAAVMLNEAGAREFGLEPEEAIGEVIRRGDTSLKIIGVMEDFHYESLHEAIYPLLLMHETLRGPQYAAVRVEPARTVDVLDALRATWQQFSDLPVNYSFLADDLAVQYEAELRLERVFGVFAGLAILIACLGLLGLAAFTAQKRTKEIGIRKAMGATVTSIVTLLSKDFLQLVGIAFVLAAPLAYVGMQQWLRNFAYRIELGVGIFLMAGGFVLLIALLTVSYQAIRAAQTDPVKALRTE